MATRKIFSWIELTSTTVLIAIVGILVISHFSPKNKFFLRPNGKFGGEVGNYVLITPNKKSNRPQADVMDGVFEIKGIYSEGGAWFEGPDGRVWPFTKTDLKHLTEKARAQLIPPNSPEADRAKAIFEEWSKE